LASEAARCAAAQGAYWRFRNLVLAGTGTPDREHLLRAGRAARLSMEDFEACVDGGSQASEIAEDARKAAALGVRTVPAVFVNGLYAGGFPESGHLVRLIEGELARLDVQSPRLVEAVRQSTSPIELRALLHADTPGLGLAVLGTQAPERGVGFYREGDALGADVILRRISADRVEILNGQVPEWIGFETPAPSNEIPEQLSDATAAPAADLDEVQLAALRYPHRGSPVILDRTEVLVRLSDVGALEASLEPVPLKAGGYHLLRVSEVVPGSLYELMALEPGDVILLVNEQPMHEGDKPLWNALQSDDEIRLRVMREGGLAQHFTYRFED
jgi:hypothetical protein